MNSAGSYPPSFVEQQNEHPSLDPSSPNPHPLTHALQSNNHIQTNNNHLIPIHTLSQKCTAAQVSMHVHPNPHKSYKKKEKGITKKK